MKKGLIITIFSVVALWGYSQNVERTEVGNAFVYKISEYTDGSSFTKGYLKESLLYRKELTYIDCPLEGNMVELKNSLLRSIEGIIPNIRKKLSRNDATMYVVLLPSTEGKIVDAYVGWSNSYREFFLEKELQGVIAAAKNISLKFGNGSVNAISGYYYPITVFIFPNLKVVLTI